MRSTRRSTRRRRRSIVEADACDSLRCRRRVRRSYPYWFYLPALVVFGVIFIVPTVLAFCFSLTRWTLFDAEFIGLDNFGLFLREPALTSGLRNTIIYAVVTSGLKVVDRAAAGDPAHLAACGSRNLLRSIIFFPVLVSTVAVGITFAVLMHPSRGLINMALEAVGIDGPSWLTDPIIALLSVALVDVWKGVGIALVIFIAGILSIPEEYIDAVRLEGGAWARFRHVIVPLSRNATFTVILLSFIGGLRTFDLIWTMTRGGPGFTTDVIDVHDLQAVPGRLLRPRDGRQRDPVHRRDADRVPDDAVLRAARDRAVKRRTLRGMVDRRRRAASIAGVVFVVPFVVHVLTAAKDRAEAARLEFSLPTDWRLLENIAEVFDTRNGLLVTAFRNSMLLTVGSVTLIVSCRRWSAFVLQRRRDRVGSS